MKLSKPTKAILLSIVTTASFATVANAQAQPNAQEVPLNPFAPRPVNDAPPPEDPDPPPADPQAQPVPVEPAPAGSDKAQEPYPQHSFSPEDESVGPEQPEPLTKKKRKPIIVKYPVVLAAPTAHLLPAAVIFSSTSLDTGGGFGSTLKVGLGDVGEFGIETTDRVRFIPTAGAVAETIQPLVLASFKMGVAEDRLFDNQPALALGFRKSFETSHEDYNIRVAAIELVASKTLGPVSVHAGGVFWDASLNTGIGTNAESTVLHDYGTKRQIRPFGGLQAEPFKDSQLLVDVYWVPRFDPTQIDPKLQITLRPALSWGVRYKVGRSISIESGVRVPDIGEANLLDAQIFGQLSFSSTKLRNALGVGY